MRTYKINKVLCFNDKRFALNKGIHMLAYFYKDLDSHRWSPVRRIQKYSHKWLQTNTNAYK